VEKLSNILGGVSGEYFVAAELSRRGYIASITLRNKGELMFFVLIPKPQNMFQFK